MPRTLTFRPYHWLKAWLSRLNKGPSVRYLGERLSLGSVRGRSRTFARPKFNRRALMRAHTALLYRGHPVDPGEQRGETIITGGRDHRFLDFARLGPENSQRTSVNVRRTKCGIDGARGGIALAA